MKLQDQIKADLKVAMKTQDVPKKEALRVVIGELGRLTEKDLSDKDVLQVIKKLMKSEKEVLNRQGAGGPSDYLKILEAYLPVMATESEIAEWIRANIDFAAYKNNMQAMGDIMRHFGSNADGSTVKKVIQEMA